MKEGNEEDKSEGLILILIEGSKLGDFVGFGVMDGIEVSSKFEVEDCCGFIVGTKDFNGGVTVGSLDTEIRDGLLDGL